MPEVDSAVYIEPATTAVEGDITLDGDLRVVEAFLLVYVFEIMCVLKDHVRLCGHLSLLEGGEKLAGVDFAFYSCFRVFYVEKSRAGFFHEHDAPGEAVTLFGPEEVAGV